jgi:pSer/pThr/pTyr-binding forkhead associated (FHA) protein
VEGKQKKAALIYTTPEGSREFTLENGELKLGRGDVDLRFADSSLSRHHATIYREGDRIWILDNNSTNGTFINDVPAAPNGNILQNGDTIRLGNETTIKLQISEQSKIAGKSANYANAQNSVNSADFNFVPLIIAGFAVIIIGLAIFVVASKAITDQNSGNDVAMTEPDDDLQDEPENNTNSRRKKPKAERTPINDNANVSASSEKPNGNPVEVDTKPNYPVAPTKTYLEMSETEKRQFIEKESKIIAQMIGNTSGDAVPPEAVERIKSFVDAFSKRLRSIRKDNCTAGGWVTSDLQTIIERASKNAEFIVPAFNSQGIAPQIGLYLAMIESEHCVCLQSPTGPLGMFQFTKATGAQFGLATKAGASPTNPDERCQPEKAAPAAARYMKFLTGRYGTGALSVPLAIASYNSGEGGLSTNLQAALAGESNQERSFWTLVANQGKLSSQFQKENIKYVPKFFAAAIVGENPSVFGVKMQPVSSNSK